MIKNLLRNRTVIGIICIILAALVVFVATPFIGEQLGTKNTAVYTKVAVPVNAVMTIVQGLIDNLPMLLEAALQLVLGLTEGILAALPQLISTLPAIITGIVDFVIGAIPQKMLIPQDDNLCKPCTIS
ncbi:MAG: hypothetical protein LBN40_00050 [Oscillospiraceae bacterium]|jgi:hypothetical protein|nr:hypothetical protein [Oscillospiraceae bacterium]